MNYVQIIIVLVILIFGFTAITGAPFVPSRKRAAMEAFQKLYPLSKKDFLIDLGSGNGKVLAIATKFGAKCLGLELNPLLVLYSKIRLCHNPLAKTKNADMFHYNFPKETTVVYVFGDGRDMKRIVKTIEKQVAKIGHPLFLISHAFEAEGREPVKAHGAYYLYKIEERK